MAGKIIGLPQNNRNNQLLAPTLQQHSFIHGLTVNNRNNHVPIPTENPFLGETLAAVDPSEVRTLSKDTNVSQTHFDPVNHFPRRHWRRRPPFWRRHHFGLQDRPFGLRFGIPEHSQALQFPPRLSEMPPIQTGQHQGLPPIQTGHHQELPPIQTGHHQGLPPIQTGHHQGLPPIQTGHHQGLPPRHNPPRESWITMGMPHNSQTDKLTSHLLHGLGLENNQHPHNQRRVANQSTQDSTKQVKPKEKPGTSEKDTSSSVTADIFSGILQKLTKNVVSNLVDKIVDKVVEKNQAMVLPGNSPHSLTAGRGFSQPFASVGHAHGPNGEFIPVNPHVHTSHGHVVPLLNQRTNRFGHQNLRNRNPFLHSSVQGSQRGWVLG